MRLTNVMYLAVFIIPLITSCESRQSDHQRIVEDSVKAVMLREMSEQPRMTLEDPGTFANFSETSDGYVVDYTFRVNGYNIEERRNVRGECTVRLKVSKDFRVDMKNGKILYQKRLN